MGWVWEGRGGWGGEGVWLGEWEAGMRAQRSDEGAGEGGVWSEGACRAERAGGRSGWGLCLLSAMLGDITRNHHLSLLELSNLFMQRLRAAGAMAAGQGDGR